MAEKIDKETLGKIFRIAGILAPVNAVFYFVVMFFVIDIPDWVKSGQEPLLWIPGILLIVLGIGLYYWGTKYE